MARPNTPAETTRAPKTANPVTTGVDDSEATAATRFRRTDAGQAEFFASIYGGVLRFDHRRGQWLIWDGQRWKPDVDGEIRRLTLDAARRRHDAAREGADDVHADEARFSHTMESRGKLQAVEDLARAVHPIADDGAGWDEAPELMGVPNGVVDLRIGVLRGGRREDRITMSATVGFDPAASCSRWLRYLDEVFNGDIDVIEFVRRAVGYTLTGECKEEVFFLLHGPGANGKTVLMRTISSVMGDYATTIPFAALESSGSGGRPSNDIAAVVGKRLVMSSETGVSTRFDEARLKSLTGRDPVAARFLYHETFVFQPVLKLWLSVNHLPSVADLSLSLWRRVLVIPFRVSFEGPRAEKDLDQTLRREADGIFAWAVEGARRWYVDGWHIPEAVHAATARYRLDNDPLGRFLSEECIVAPNSSVMAGAAYERYDRWAQREGLPASSRLTLTAFGLQMKQRFESTKKAAGVTYFGVDLRPIGRRGRPR